MSNMAARGAAFLARQITASAGVTVRYSRDSASVTLTAVPGKSPSAAKTGGGSPARVDWTERDYLIPAAALVLNGAPVTPAKGDVIEETIDGVARRFRLEKRPDEAEWRWSDQSRVMYRVHTKPA